MPATPPPLPPDRKRSLIGIFVLVAAGIIMLVIVVCVGRHTVIEGRTIILPGGRIEDLGKATDGHG